MTSIGKFSLDDAGAFNIKLEFVWWDSSGAQHRQSGTDSFNGTKVADPGNYGIADGSKVALYVNVIGGNDKQAKEQFTYQKGSGAIAAYRISGTTLNNTLTLMNVTGGEIGISKLPAPSTTGMPALSSGKVRLFRDSNWSSEYLEIDTASYAADVRHSISGSSLQDKATWVAFNLPVGMVMTLTNNVVMNPPNGRLADLKDAGEVVDLVGTGQTEAVDLTKVGMNDKVSMLFYRRVDLDFGALELYSDSSYTGTRTVVFLSEWPGNKVHSVIGWHINDRASSARWSTLQDTQSAILYADPPDANGNVTTGTRYSNITGWLTQKDIVSFSDAGFNDTISAFSWGGLIPKKEVIKDLVIELDSYADYSSGLTQYMTGHNDSSTTSSQTITLTKSDAETTTVTVTNTYTAGITLSVSREKGCLITGKWNFTVGVSFQYSHTDTRTVSDTKTETVSVSQTFTVPPYSDYEATLIVHMGQIPDSTYKTAADRWYDIQLPGSILDPANGWYKRTEDIYVEITGTLACASELNIKATPLPAAAGMVLEEPVIQQPVIA